MASSDDEVEFLPESVSDYDFQEEDRAPISFSVLQLRWADGDTLDGQKSQIFLQGFVDNGLQKIYKTVTAWKFDLSEEAPVICVLLKNDRWIRLQKPRKSYEERIRSILITIHSLHFFKKEPESSEKSLWEHVDKTFSFDLRPSQNDLIDHMHFIREAVTRDETLEKSMFLLRFIERKPRRRKEYDEVSPAAERPGFIVDEDDILDETEKDESDDEDYLFDSVCAICDNGGDLLCCEGRCLRSFHATEEAGDESACESLGFTDDQVEAMAMHKFLCENCLHKRHQCYCCGKLGSSDKQSGAEVFSCVNATCGHFYHPHCVARMLHRDDEAAADDIRKKIAAGEAFTCPIHKCFVCKMGENKMVPELQFAVCRRCPKSYHRKCLPRKIAFDDDPDEGIIQRAWEDLLPNRILIYCLKHEIIDDIGTPVRDHIKFHDRHPKKIKESKLLPGKGMSLKRKTIFDEDIVVERTARKALLKSSRRAYLEARGARRSGEMESHKKMKVNGSYVKPSVESAKLGLKKKAKPFVTDGGRASLGDKLFDMMHSSKTKPSKTSTQMQQDKKPSAFSLDSDGRKRILEFMRDSISSVTLEDVTKKHQLPSTHSFMSRTSIDKTITQGKIEGSVEALRAALHKLERGGTVEDAKAVCEPEILHQIVRWKNKLKVYLAPFLHGMRYTSFGRHFTPVHKLQEVVDKLHHYVQDGDMIVDFCCGANDFSWLMKIKLDETGKKQCLYKNFDIIHPKNDFNFEKRDWMSVKTHELPSGSRLIMGLNPPFGVKASLANQFVDKALEFKPKIIILIVPPETQRLDEKRRSHYDLIWSDISSFSGKSFYLPGSVDVNDKQLEQWNLTSPVLSLWCRPDFTSRLKSIAHKCGHLTDTTVGSKPERNYRDHEDAPVERNDSVSERIQPPETQAGVVYGKTSLTSRRDETNADEKSPLPLSASSSKNKKNKQNKGPNGQHQEHSDTGKENGSTLESSEHDRSLQYSPTLPNGRVSFDQIPTHADANAYGSSFSRPYHGIGDGLTSHEAYTPRWSDGSFSEARGYGLYGSQSQVPSHYVQQDREAEIRSTLLRYGQHNPDIISPRGSYSATPEASYQLPPSMLQSADRYSDYAGMSGPGLPRHASVFHDGGRMGEVGPSGHPSNLYDPAAMARYGAESGFASGPQRSYSRQTSADKMIVQTSEELNKKKIDLGKSNTNTSKTPKKKRGAEKEGQCHHCNKPGHWKRNCKLYLEEVAKLKGSKTPASGAQGV